MNHDSIDPAVTAGRPAPAVTAGRPAPADRGTRTAVAEREAPPGAGPRDPGMVADRPDLMSADRPDLMSADQPDPMSAADDLLALADLSTSEPATSSQAEALALAVSANLPVLLWGAPGIGKSATLYQLARTLRAPLETVIASVHEPSDFAGLPIVGDDPARNGVPLAPPDWAVRIARRRRGIVFFDELSSAPPAVQAALLRVVLERRVGSLALPPSVRIVAAANPPDSAADGWQLSPPLANRFVHLQWGHDPLVVARGMTGTWPRPRLPVVRPEAVGGALARARGIVAGFLTARPGLAHAMPADPQGRAGAWPSPRTWDMAVRLLAVGFASGAGREAIAEAVVGAVGAGVGLELLSFLENADLPDPELVLADPARAELPDRGDRQLAFLSAVVCAVRHETTRDRWEAGWEVLARAVEAGVPDVAARAAMDLAALRDSRWPVPAGIEAFVELLSQSGALQDA